jgi:hypothetical protein
MSKPCILLGRFALSVCSLVAIYGRFHGIPVSNSTLENFELKCFKLQESKNEGEISSIHPNQILKIGNTVLSVLGFQAGNIKEGLMILCCLTKKLPIHPSSQTVFGILRCEFEDRFSNVVGDGSLDDECVFSALNYLMAMIWIAFEGARIPKSTDFIAKGLQVGKKSKIVRIIFENIQ